MQHVSPQAAAIKQGSALGNRNLPERQAIPQREVPLSRAFNWGENVYGVVEGIIRPLPYGASWFLSISVVRH
jgi:hypothetical protein